ncbi:hypothetical protein IC789_02900 [Acinetobacter seifertii]|jgi:hypothetical protein|uniref:Uncharacterized protein n=2 Tax=Acinetobacter TaxID=469 RepID=N9RGA1_9GAMM|nr:MULTISPECIES: hypothetical protein [Acinetobacter]MBJ9953210.1 hypothetical protein [Acinetobacter baumannii]ENW97787.1 hypothetical protein F903_00310 [Acinetobacter sp. NIPH 298]ENX37650.1 hypothetical protein F888_02992 [Acinetobacter courvalinii]KAB0658984.1 hypothetical protein F7P77_15080 [Acinetobacter courvalinii]MBD1230500.1 hypothetical protein [Acinetobacter seifertii]
MSYLDNEEEIYNPRFREAQPLQLSLASAPTTLAVLGMSLAKSMGFSPLIGGVAGAALGGVILVLADQTRSNISTAKY